MKHHRRNVFCVSVNVALSCDWSEWLERIHAKPSAQAGGAGDDPTRTVFEKS